MCSGMTNTQVQPNSIAHQRQLIIISFSSYNSQTFNATKLQIWHFERPSFLSETNLSILIATTVFTMG